MKKTTKKDNAKRYLKRDLERFAANIDALARAGKRHWAHDAEMTKQFAKDECDLRTIYDAVRDGKLNRAAWLMYRLDTIVRDRIPARLFNTIENAI